MKISIASLLANIVLNVVIVVPMLRAGIVGAHAGLALATGLAAVLNAGLLYRGLRRDGVYRPVAGWGRLFAQVLIANTCMAALLVWLAGGLDPWLSAAATERAGRLALCVAAGLAIYVLALLAAGLRPRDLKPLHAES